MGLLVNSGSLCPFSFTAETRNSYSYFPYIPSLTHLPNGYLATMGLLVSSGSLCPFSLTAETRNSYSYLPYKPSLTYLPNGYLATMGLLVSSGSLCPFSLTADTRNSYSSSGSRSSTGHLVPIWQKQIKYIKWQITKSDGRILLRFYYEEQNPRAKRDNNLMFFYALENKIWALTAK